MKTTVDIPESTLEEVMRIAKAKTMREAVLYSMNEVIRQEKLRKTLDSFGTFKGMMTLEELYENRRK